MTDKYILNESGTPVAEPDLMTWAKWFETADRKVAVDQISDAKVSTIFLSIDLSYQQSGPPILWETKVFGGALDQETDRCSGSREQAEAMHARMVQRVKEIMPQPAKP